MAIKKTTDQILSEFRAVHSDTYDYSNVAYENINTPVEIICKKHGVFKQQPRAHKSGQGCPKCKVSENWVPKRDTESFIKRAQEIHKDRYDYSKTVYIKTMAPVKIICPIHGEFEQLANSHLNGRGCQQCANNQPRSAEQFIELAKQTHNNKYDYSCIDRNIIICPKHGGFIQDKNNHLQGKGCPDCAAEKPYIPINKRKTTQDFLAQLPEENRDRYDYSKVEYVSANKKVIIICKLHGPFSQRPSQHVYGRGCPKCGIESMKSKHRSPFDKFVSDANEVHGQYKYGEESFVDYTTPTEITCHDHGVFKQRPRDHVNSKNGCPKCAGNKLLTTPEFVEKAQLIHHDRYDYSRTVYSKSSEQIKVVCLKHGEFTITAGYHLQGGGCPTCSLSTQQYQILAFVKTITDDVISNDRTAIAPYELDILIPQSNLAIEFNGNFYHSYNSLTIEDRNKHKEKTDLAIKAGIKLIQINSHEWKRSQELIKSMISHRLGVSQKIHGRKCEIVAVSDKTASDFFKENHISGHRSAKVTYGLIYDDTLVSVINFNQIRPQVWEIIRYATSRGHVVVGGLSKLLRRFKEDHKPQTITTFVDRRFGDGNGYLKSGFKLCGITKPGYVYLDSNCNLAGSRIKFQKHKLPGILERFNPDLTEAENMFNNGYRRMWDAGHLKMELNCF